MVSFRDPRTKQPRTRTVKTIEKLPILERSRLLYEFNGAKHMTAEEWLVLKEAGDFSLERPTETYVGDCYKGGGTAVGWHHLKASGLSRVLHSHLGRKSARVLQELILHQLIRPESKLQFVDHRKTCLVYALEGKEAFGKDTVYRALDELAASFGKIRQGLNDLSPDVPSRRLKYDLSNSYFCGYKAELGGYGQSKEKRHDRFIVTYGLVLDENDTPLDIRVWKGGTADTQTVKQTFGEWKTRYNSKEATWIADRSMSGVETVEIISELELNYITGVQGQTQKSMLLNMIENSPGLFDTGGLEELNFDGNRYVLCRHYEKGFRKETQNFHKRREVHTELKAIQNSKRNKDEKKLYHRAMKVLERYGQSDVWAISLSKVPAIEDGSKKTKKAKPDTRFRLEFSLNRKRVKNLDKTGHFYLLQTDHTEARMNKEEVQKAYKSLIGVERCFRNMKSHIELRPIRHRLSQRIEAHIYLCFLSLWLSKNIENQWKGRGINVEVPMKLAQWDEKVLYCETLDQKKTVTAIKWNRGANSTEATEEIASFGETAAISAYW